MTGSACPTSEIDALSACGAPARSGRGVEARRRLRRSGCLALRDIACEVEGIALRLRGKVPSYYLKQVAQALVAEVEGVARVVNMIRVLAPPPRPPSGRDRPSRS